MRTAKLTGTLYFVHKILMNYFIALQDAQGVSQNKTDKRYCCCCHLTKEGKDKPNYLYEKFVTDIETTFRLFSFQLEP